MPEEQPFGGREGDHANMISDSGLLRCRCRHSEKDDIAVRDRLALGSIALVLLP